MSDDEIQVVYLATRYSAPTAHERAANVERAKIYAKAIMDLRRNWIVIPAVNLSDGTAETHDGDWWYSATMAVLRRCDRIAVSFDDLYQHESKGVASETLWAINQGWRPLVFSDDGTVFTDDLPKAELLAQCLKILKCK